jgi:hypothetical protein
LRASVNAPRSCPNSSASIKLSGSAAHDSATNGPSRRVELRWIARAMTSLPVPLSPSMRIDASVLATVRTVFTTSFIGGDDPMTFSKPVEPPEILGQRAVLVLEVAHARDALDEQHQFLVQERLQHVVERALAHRVDGGVDGAVRGHQDDLGRAVLLARGAQHVEPRGPRHADVGDDDVERVRLQADQTLLAVSGGDHAVPDPRQRILERDADRLLVVDDQDLERMAGPLERRELPSLGRRCDIPEFGHDGLRSEHRDGEGVHRL